MESKDDDMVVDDSTVKRRVIPWTEKYRPATVNDVSHQDEVIQTLKTSIDQGNLPHLMFHGPPGTGKTTTILAVARALYGPDLYRSRILELNASDDRGISVVREKIKSFAQGAVGTHKSSGYPCPRFKLIVLDEADTMTPEAQSALRRIMEAYSKVTRFCIICNYVTRIIEPLASRCAKFRFKPLPVHSMRDRLHHISEVEGVRLAEGSLDLLMTAAGGDMRKAITYLQSCHQLSSLSDAGVTSDVVLDISGQMPAEVMNDLWVKMSAKYNRFDAVKVSVDTILYEGFPLYSILAQLHADTIAHATLSDVDKALICEKIAQCDQNLIDGASEELQLLDVAAFISRRFMGLQADVDISPAVH